MNKKDYLVVRCPQCGHLLLSRPEYRTRKCVHCGSVIPMSQAAVLGRAGTSIEASELIRELKMKSRQ